MPDRREEIFDACERVMRASTGLSPAKVTIAMVREELGGTGSQSTLTKYVGAWKEAMRSDADMPAAIKAGGNQLIEAIWAQAKEAAAAEFHEQRVAMEAQFEEMQSLQLQNKNEIEALQALNETLYSHHEMLEAEANKLSGALDEAVTTKINLEERNEALVEENSALVATRYDYKAQIAALTTHRDVLQEMIDRFNMDDIQRRPDDNL